MLLFHLRLKSKLLKVSLGVVRDSVPFEVDSDSSDYLIAALLLQQGKPVTYFLRMLNFCEKYYPAVEKESTTIIEAVCKWSHFLKGRHFLLTSDQRSITFIVDKNK